MQYVGGCFQQIMNMAEVCLHADKLDQDANSIYPQEWYVTLFPMLECGPIIWISGLLVPVLPACVSRPLNCKRPMDRYTFRIQANLCCLTNLSVPDDDDDFS